MNARSGNLEHKREGPHRISPNPTDGSGMPINSTGLTSSIPSIDNRMTIIRSRGKALLERFQGRDDLGKIGLYETFFRSLGYPESDVLECLDEVELGFGIPPGVLRPEDPMRLLSERVHANNPIEWFWWVGDNEFGSDGLFEELQIRLVKHGTQKEWKLIETFGDLVRAWCGEHRETPNA